ncbi:hypothetical protein NJC40_14450 [Pseudomonas sp. 21LCFQ02]|uniref:hypothetical protein n=1 Tax=Pseudomonas sp. 21LCFQ02 TaxID=2957505 RepID=UPI00209AB57D|nr:hypothetical protein [Pseudomonas sp. 21LCFQ02]MCO8168970.1 hypothetical protein [Pseudomonas sp. 21LCFQ02]
MSNEDDIRRGWHGVFKLHDHGVFVTKYRRIRASVSPCYCASSCGGASIEQQQTPHCNQGRLRRPRYPSPP